MKVYSSIAVQNVVEALLPRFEKETGARPEVIWGTAPMLIRRLQGGETADLLILNRVGIDTMTKAGRVRPGTEAVIASSATAIAVRQGAPKPDISSAEALKKTLRDARAISYSHPDAGGASGIYFAKLLDQWGMRAEIDAKTRFPPPAGLCGAFLVTGDVDLALQQVPELMAVKGVEIVGTLPGDLHMVTVFVAGIEASSKKVAGAQALLDLLRSPEAKALFKAKGLEAG
ncbi:MAG TPA: substrate-binding domain-containing protein [Reyranella sp.]|nr:substrate-binding domain-containing protein [Reyranella sp.]